MTNLLPLKISIKIADRSEAQSAIFVHFTRKSYRIVELLNTFEFQL